MAEREWQGATYGNGWMHRCLVNTLKVVDVRILYVFSYIFVVPICVLLNKSRKTSYFFMRHRIGFSPLKAAWKTYVNHCLFSQVVIDRFAMYAGKKFKTDIEGYEHFLKLAKQKDAFVQLSAHVGNYEIAGYTLVAEDKPFNALVFFGEKESVMRGRNKMFEHTNIRMIPVRQDMSHLFEIDRALADGETLSMPADRLFGSKKTLEMDFLGAKADFPLGPFSVPTMRGVDVLAVNVMKTRAKRYKIFVKPIPYDKQAPRKEQIRQLALAYVSELENIVKTYPTQWYNYFDFWK